MRKIVVRLVSVFAVVGLVITQIGAGVASATGSPPSPASAQVYLTLPDQSKLVARQTDLSFATNRAPVPNELSVRVDPNRTYQTMDGVGAAMTESSAYLFSQKMSEAQRTEAFQKLFNKQTGAGIDVVRVPWGATDFSLSNYTYNDRLPGQGDDVPQNDFTIANDMNYLVPMLQKAVQTNGQIKLFFAPWSPPRWMKTNILAPPEWPLATGNLRPDLWGSYTTYLTKSINSYTVNWLWPAAFAPQNHPTILTSHPSMFMNAQEQANLIKNTLGPEVRDFTMAKPKIMTLDDDWSKVEYPLSVLGDTAAAQFTGGTAFHCYNGEPTQQLRVQKAHPTKDIYFTECTGSNTPPAQWGGDFAWGVRNLIINSTRDYAKTVIYWNLALDETAGPKTSTTAGCQNCRGIVTVKADGTTTQNAEYYILKHYGQFVRQGATRIDSTTYGQGAIETVAFKNPDGSRALIALNSGTTPRDFTVREGNASIRYNLPAGAAATFTWNGTVNNKIDVDTGRIEAEANTFAVPAWAPKLDVVDDGKQDQAMRLNNGNQLHFCNTNFQGGTPVSFQMRYTSQSSGTVELRQDTAFGPLLASIPFAPSTWKTTDVITGTIAPAAGQRTLVAVVKNAGPTSLDINWFKLGQNPVATTPVDRTGWKPYGVYGGGNDAPGNVLDGNESTRWSTGYPMTYGHWFTLDLGKQTVLNGLTATSPTGDYPRKLKVEVSDNGLDYQVVQPGLNITTNQYEVPFTGRAIARYVRLSEQSETTQGNWWSMNELNLLNK